MLTSSVAEPGGGKTKTVTKVVDFDGTLFFTERSVSEASKDITGKRLTPQEIHELPKPERWEIYDRSDKKYSKLAVPNEELVEILRKDADMHEIIILTARTAPSTKKVLWLLERDEVPFDALIIREPDGNGIPKNKDEEWKAETLKILKRGCETVEVYEDKMDNIAHLKQQLGEDGIAYFFVSKEGIKRV